MSAGSEMRRLDPGIRSWFLSLTARSASVEPVPLTHGAQRLGQQLPYLTAHQALGHPWPPMKP